MSGMELSQNIPQDLVSLAEIKRNTQIKINWRNATPYYLEECEVSVSDDDGAPQVVVQQVNFGLIPPQTTRTQYTSLPTGFEKAATRFKFGGQVYTNFGLGDNVEELNITIGQ